MSSIRDRFRWPRGRYNGRRIGGFTLKVDIDLLRWAWLPRWSRFGMVRLTATAWVRWLCVGLWIEPHYELFSPERREELRRIGALG